MIKAVRVLLDQDPFKDPEEKQEAHARGTWPANWIHCDNITQAPFVAGYKLHFEIPEKSDIRIHVTADERYELFLDGQRIGRGPERGDINNWFFESFDLRLSAGTHTIAASVWSLGKLAPQAQISLRHGLLIAAEEPFAELINTGLAPWETKILDGYAFSFNQTSWGAGADIFLDGNKMDWDFLQESKGWSRALPGLPGVTASEFADYSIKGHLLRPATLPPMLSNDLHLGKVRYIDEPETAETWRYPASSETCCKELISIWNGMLEESKAISIPAFKRQRVIIDLEDYYCAYPKIIISRGTEAFVRIHWAESLYEKSCTEQLDNPKGQRDIIEDKFFIGVGDSLRSEGGTSRVYGPLWWRAGRYVELFIQTADEPLIIENLTFEETRYPLEMESSFECSEVRISKTLPIMTRVMQMCSHETFMDCPYYEQLMYTGDSRLISLIGYCMTLDDSLQRKAIEMFNLSQLPSGFTRSQYPSRVTQIIPPFSLWWIAMVYDYAMWRGDKEFIKQQMPGVRRVIDAFLQQRNQDGVIVSPAGWNFVDWVPEWERGVPPDGENGISGVINWQFVYVLKKVAKLETWLGENELSRRAIRIGNEFFASLVARLWDSKRALFADDLDKQNFSEHTQCMALLSGFLDEKMCQQIAYSLFSAKRLTQTTIYFSHYYFEACKLLGRTDKLLERFKLWFDLESQGFKTTFETPGNTRSDCHAWGAHPIYHCFATIAGIRPTSFGFKNVKIAPLPGNLSRINGKLVHPSGEIKVELHCKNDSLNGTVSLPEGISGYFIWNGTKKMLLPGSQEISFQDSKNSNAK